MTKQEAKRVAQKKIEDAIYDAVVRIADEEGLGSVWTEADRIAKRITKQFRRGRGA